MPVLFLVLRARRGPVRVWFARVPEGWGDCDSRVPRRPRGLSFVG